MDTLRITKNQPFVLYVPLVILNADGTKEPVHADTLTDIQVTLQAPCGTTQAIVPTAFEQWLVLSLPATLATSVYNVLVTATLAGGRDFSLRIKNCFAVVDWDEQSNWRDYIVGDHIALDQAFIAGVYITDAEYTELKAELRAAVAAAEQAKEDADAAKAAWEQKAAELQGVAQEQTLTQGVADIRDDISHIDIDTTTLAKATSVKDGNDTAISVGKEIRSEVGTGSDTAAETGTLFAVIKWIKDKVKGVYDYIGTPAQGQPSTLFAAIAAVGQGNDSKQTIVDAINQMGGNATANMTWAQLAYQITTLPNMYDGAVLLDSVQKPINLAGYVMGGFVGIKEAVITGVTTLNYNLFRNNATIEKLSLPDLTGIAIASAFQSCAKLKEVSAPLLTGFAMVDYIFAYCTNLQKLYIPSLSFVRGNNAALDGCVGLIDMITGGSFNNNFNFTALRYNPSNAYNNSISTLCYQSDIDEYGQIFHTNWEKWKWCIINHFAANLPDKTGMTAFTITFGSTVLSHFDAEMIAAFTDKNWTLA